MRTILRGLLSFCRWLLEVNEIATDWLAHWLSVFARRVSLIAVLVVGGGVTLKLALASRNSSGSYTLATSAVTSSQTIGSGLWNTTFSDLATSMTDSLDRNGRGGMLAALRGVDGTVAAPAFSWTSETGSGYYRIGAGDLGLSILGTKTGEWTANGLRVANGAVATPSLSFFNDTGGGLYRIGSNDFGFAVNGVKTQEWTATGSSVTGTFAVSGATTATGGITIGGSGNAITSSFSGSAAITGAVVTSNQCRTADTITVTGASAGDTCFLGPPSGGAGPAIDPYCYVSSANTVTIALCNIDSTSSHTSTTGTYKARTFN